MSFSKYLPFLVVCLFLTSPLNAAEAFKSIHATELNQKIKAKSELEIYDANLESTRKFVGLIEGAHLLSSASDYDTAKELPKNKTTPLVFYCANNLCTASHTAAKKAIAAGYKNVSVMVDGIYGWKKAGFAMAKWNPAKEDTDSPKPPSQSATNEVRALLPKEAQDLVNRKAAVIVDVREEEERHQVIKESLWFPMSKLKSESEWLAFRTQLPSNKLIIFHCAAGVRAKKMALHSANEGIKTAYFESLDQWKKAGLPLEKGPAL